MTGDTEMKNNISPEEDELVDVEQYRKLVKTFIDARRYQTALFWAEKVAVLSQNDPKDIYWQAQCMFLLKEYHRAAHTIKINGLEKSNIPCYNLLLESLYEAKEYLEAISVINNIDVDFLATSLTTIHPTEHTTEPDHIWLEDDSKNETMASISFLKGKIFESMDNRAMAMDYYVQALQKSVYCYEALEALVQHEMLMAWEEKELIQHLPFSIQCNEADSKLIKKLYESKLKKYYETIGPQTNAEQTPIGNVNTLRSIKELTEKIQKNRTNEVKVTKNLTSKLFTPTQERILSPANRILEDLKNTPSYSLQTSLSRVSSASMSNGINIDTSHKSKISTESPNTLSLSISLQRVQDSTDLIASEAEKFFYDCEYKKSLKLLDELLKRDPYHNAGLTVQIGCLVELKDFNKLFSVAHKLVDHYPDKSISWYAVGCYYDLIGKSDPARRYLCKATSLDRLYGPAWLAYGHSFAKENEHDQAMAAYFKATQLMRGCHLPLLYIGVECGLTKNLELAEKFFYQAMSIAPLDVFVLHELGVIKYEYEYFESAEEVFRTTADIVTSRAQQNKEEISPRWEPLFNNLGHCCRKNKKFDEALEYHQLALLLKPDTSETYTAIGFVNALIGKLEDAITYFHKSLAINRDCVVTATILKTCIEDLMHEESIFDKIYDKSPKQVQMKVNRLMPVKDTPMKLNCIKLKFDDDDVSTNSATGNINSVCDMSMEI